MRTNFSWLLGSATVACAAVGSVVATLWLLGLNPNGTESAVLQAGPDSRPAVFHAEALPRPHQTVPKRKPAVAHRPRAAALPVRVQLPFVRRVVAPVHAAPAEQAPHVATWPHVVVGAPVLAPEPARPPSVVPTSPAAPPAVPTAPAVPNPPASPVPQPTTPEPPPAAPEAQLAAATVQTGTKKSTGKDGKTVVPPRKPGPQPTPTPGPVGPTLHEGDHDGGNSTPKLDSSEQRAKGNRHDKHGGD